MKGKVFVDSNILIYLFSETEPDKRATVVELLEQTSHLVWSTQIIQEFYQVMTSKYGKKAQNVKTILRNFYHFELIVNNLKTIEGAIDIQSMNQLSFWDSLVVSAALQSNCRYILTEDLTHGQTISGVKIMNPFI